jgi:hypothetical protein
LRPDYKESSLARRLKSLFLEDGVPITIAERDLGVRELLSSDCEKLFCLTVV